MGVPTCIKAHLKKCGISLPEKFTTTAVRTAGSTSIQQNEVPKFNQIAQKIFCHSSSTQESSYRGELEASRLVSYKSKMDNLVAYSRQTVISLNDVGQDEPSASEDIDAEEEGSDEDETVSRGVEKITRQPDSRQDLVVKRRKNFR